MYLKITLSLLIITYAKAYDVVLPYTMVAYTTSGAPCIGGCSPDTHLCVASWPAKNEPCVLHSTPAPRSRTTQAVSRYPYCLSNCGKYAWNTAWCFVTGAGEYDYCTPSDNQVTVTVAGSVEVLPYTTVASTTSGKPCIGGCSQYTHQCVVSWPPKNEPCVLSNTPAPTAFTTKQYSKYSTCLSNCGAYDWSTPWCYVTKAGEWDYCTPQGNQVTGQNQVTSSVEVLPYTMVAYTSSGKPCIGGCSPYIRQCVVGWPPKNEPCILSGTPAPTVYTTQKHTRYSTCLSNCGAYDWSTPWCYVTKAGEWDDCTPVGNQATGSVVSAVTGSVEVLPYFMIAHTTSGKPCIGGCSEDTHQCVVGWPPKNEPCVLSNSAVPQAYTTQKYSKHRLCLSNCGAFDWSTPWCYVTRTGEWDDCTPQAYSSTQAPTIAVGSTNNQQAPAIQPSTSNNNTNTNDIAVVLSYDEVAYTSTGAPCMGGCSPYTHQCVASWPPKNEPCVSHNTLAPKFRTTEIYSKHRYCLSNCGLFAGRTFAWCYVSYDGYWDTCFQAQGHQQINSNAN